jgi:hypothetical protein
MGHASMVASSNSNDRFGMSTLRQTFEHALIGSDFSKPHRADKSSQRACREVELLMVAISGGSHGLLTTASHQGAEYRRNSSSEHSSYSFFFIKTTPMIRVIHQHYTMSVLVIWSTRIF